MVAVCAAQVFDGVRVGCADSGPVRPDGRLAVVEVPVGRLELVVVAIGQFLQELAPPDHELLLAGRLFRYVRQHAAGQDALNEVEARLELLNMSEVPTTLALLKASRHVSAAAVAKDRPECPSTKYWNLACALTRSLCGQRVGLRYTFWCGGGCENGGSARLHQHAIGRLRMFAVHLVRVHTLALFVGQECLRPLRVGLYSRPTRRGASLQTATSTSSSMVRLQPS